MEYLCLFSEQDAITKSKKEDRKTLDTLVRLAKIFSEAELISPTYVAQY